MDFVAWFEEIVHDSPKILQTEENKRGKRTFGELHKDYDRRRITNAHALKGGREHSSYCDRLDLALRSRSQLRNSKMSRYMFLNNKYMLKLYLKVICNQMYDVLASR